MSGIFLPLVEGKWHDAQHRDDGVRKQPHHQVKWYRDGVGGGLDNPSVSTRRVGTSPLGRGEKNKTITALQMSKIPPAGRMREWSAK
ncbi:MAG: hypothetical protein M1470_09910 [Bacteroidetes bacterium]|nr:hypothetical protein [Bacteroidota bacterium]MCL5738705.1 hypothetical protein [Bacteroidota bacterium]